MKGTPASFILRTTSNCFCQSLPRTAFSMSVGCWSLSGKSFFQFAISFAGMYRKRFFVPSDFEVSRKGVNPRGDKGWNLPTLIFRQNGDELSESFFTKCIQHDLLVLARPVSSGYLKQFLTPRRGRLQDLIEMLHGSLPS